MGKTARALWAVSLSLCFVLQTQLAIHAQTDVVDSDQFYQQNLQSGPDLSADRTKKIEDLLKQMTLEEKVGQMTQLAIGMIINGRDQDFQIDPAKLDKAIVKYGVGSI